MHAHTHMPKYICTHTHMHTHIFAYTHYIRSQTYSLRDLTGSLCPFLFLPLSLGCPLLTVPSCLPRGAHTHLPPQVHLGGCQHWSQRGWGGRAGGAGWPRQGPAQGPNSQHSHHHGSPGNTSTPCPSLSCRLHGTEAGESCGTCERQQEFRNLPGPLGTQSQSSEISIWRPGLGVRVGLVPLPGTP